jgi:hypothetical protein
VPLTRGVAEYPIDFYQTLEEMEARIQTINLFDKLRTLGLPVGDYAVFGSGPLVVRGLTREYRDLDVVARGAAWERR